MTTPKDSLKEGLRSIPSVNALLDKSQTLELLGLYPRSTVLLAIHECLDDHRRKLVTGELEATDAELLLQNVTCLLSKKSRQGLHRVINATGIIIHTNLGRAPLAEAALRAVLVTAAGYSNLEYDLQGGHRGARGGACQSLLCQLTGSEAALVVNNNAAGVLLALSALADGGEVIVSRGEMIEIGGSFRIPDVVRQGGARLVEVGATNKTRLNDYADAITENTRVLLKVHPSNFRMNGFTEATSLADLASLAQKRGLILISDIGSGALIDLTQYGLPPEPTIERVLRHGVHVAAFSGDKLLGGPQCGLLVGKKALVQRMGSHPLFRALRADKLSLAALEATLRLYLEPNALIQHLPVMKMLTEPMEILQRRARHLSRALRRLPGMTVTMVSGNSFSGGGALPEERLPSQHVQVRRDAMPPNRLAERLRHNSPPVIGRVAQDSVVLDVRTIRDSEIIEVVQAFRALGGSE